MSYTSSAHTQCLDRNVSVRLLVQTDGALLLQLQQPSLNVDVPLGCCVLLLDHPPQRVDLGAGGLVCLLSGHQGGVQSTAQ